MNKIFIIYNATHQYAILKKLVSEKYGIDKNKLFISVNSHGKPFFENYPHIHFNISHSSCFTAIAISEKPVGIDIEKLRKVDLRVAKRFNEEEYQYVKEINSQTRFFEIWTAKEAFLKQKGCGISGGLKSFSVFHPDVPIKTFGFEDYIISVCAEPEFETVILN